MFGWLKKAVNSAGSGLVHGINAAGSAIGKVPVVGGGLKGVFSVVASPLKLTGNIANGRRLDRAMMDHFHDQLGAAKDVAPYAQTVVSFVPGVGNIASGAIGAGIALAKGQPISEALIEATKGALPGGALAKSAFDAAHAVVQGKPIEEIGLSAIPGLDDTQKKALVTAARAAKDIAAGKNVAHSVYEQSVKQLPAAAQKALAVGVALSHGANLQKTIVKNVKLEDVKGFGDLGTKLVGANPVLKAGFDTLTDPKAKTGYKVAMGLSTAKLKPIDIIAVRKRLPPNQTKGFDLGMSTHIGMSTKKAPKKLVTPEEQFGYYTTHGMSGQPIKNKAAMVKTVMHNPKVKKGMKTAVKDNAWWKRILHEIGIDVK